MANRSLIRPCGATSPEGESCAVVIIYGYREKCKWHGLREDGSVSKQFLLVKSSGVGAGYVLASCQEKGSRSFTLTAVSFATSTNASGFPSCIRNSRQRPQGGRMSLFQLTATIFSTRFSPAVSMAAMAACSAQKPMLQAVSMHTP